MKLYNGEKRCGITAESALFVCNKWDEVENKANPEEIEELKKEIIDKLRKKIPDLDEISQVIEMSVMRAGKVQEKFQVMNDDLKRLVDGLKGLLTLCVERKTDHFY